MPLFRGKNKEKEQIGLVIDVGSFSVAGALVYLHSEKSPEIIFSKRIHFPLNEKGEGEELLKTISRSLENLLEIILKEGSLKLHMNLKKLGTKKIEKIFYVVSSPWCLSKTETIKIDKERPEPITSNTLIKTVEGSVSKDDKYRLIEKKIIQVKLNGYVTENPLGKRASNIEISVFEGKILNKVSDIINSTLSRLAHVEILIHSYTLCYFSVIRDIFPEDENFLLVEITGEETELVISENGTLLKSSSFGVGKNLFLKNISEEFNVSLDVSLSFLKLYHEKKSEENFQGKIENIVNKTEEKWNDGLEKSLEEMEAKYPQKVFLSAGSSLDSFFVETLKRKLEGFFKISDIKIVSMNNKSLGQFCNFGENQYDSFLGVESIFMDKLKTED